jgi:hypothetical protein
MPFNEAELANLLLCMCTDSWQNQYNLSQENVLQDCHRLVIVLENIEKLGVTVTATQKPAANGTRNAKSKGKPDTKGNHKGTDSSANQSNKKKQMEKHCVLCQKYDGKPATHNAGDCTKYEKDGTIKLTWISSKYLADKTKKKPGGNSYTQLRSAFSQRKTSASRKQ